MRENARSLRERKRERERERERERGEKERGGKGMIFGGACCYGDHPGLNARR